MIDEYATTNQFQALIDWFDIILKNTNITQTNTDQSTRIMILIKIIDHLYATNDRLTKMTYFTSLQRNIKQHIHPRINALLQKIDTLKLNNNPEINESKNKFQKEQAIQQKNISKYTTTINEYIIC